MEPKTHRQEIVAALLIAHGSRRQQANDDLAELAARLSATQMYPIVEIAYLEISSPTIHEGGAKCVERGADRVLLLPYFLSAGNHVVQDLEQGRAKLAVDFPSKNFTLCAPLSPHPLLLDVVLDRLATAEFGDNA